MNMKLRAWDMESKVMIDTGFHILGETTAFGLIESYLAEHNPNNRPILERLNDVVIMPHIEVKDINKVDIYLYDIIELADGSRGTVEFSNGAFYHTAAHSGMGLLYWNKVIGNKFENPTLL